MTSACGVVESIDTKEHGLYEGRIDRKVRAAMKGQKAVTVEFIKEGTIDRAFVEDVEKHSAFREDIPICMLRHQTKTLIL